MYTNQQRGRGTERPKAEREGASRNDSNVTRAHTHTHTVAEALVGLRPSGHTFSKQDARAQVVREVRERWGGGRRRRWSRAHTRTHARTRAHTTRAHTNTQVVLDAQEGKGEMGLVAWEALVKGARRARLPPSALAAWLAEAARLQVPSFHHAWTTLCQPLDRAPAI